MNACAQAPAVTDEMLVAETLMSTGEVDAARAAAAMALRSAEAQNDQHRQARALLCLAFCDRSSGRFRRAHDAAQKATHLFRVVGDVSGESTALALLAHACSYLGRDEEAVESALLSVTLGDSLGPGPHQAFAHNYLGLAYLWSGSYGNAEEALVEADRLAKIHGARSASLQPLLNLVWVEVMRLAKERSFTGHLGDTATLEERILLCAGRGVAPDEALSPDAQAILQHIVKLTQVLVLCWTGRLTTAQELWSAAAGDLRPQEVPPSVEVIARWVRTELSWAARDWAGALQDAAALIAYAGQVEFEQLAYVGHLILTQIHEQLERPDLALAEMRELRKRELRVRRDILGSRQKVVQAQLDVRNSERRLAYMTLHSEELERLSFEDMLTGLPNRRRFEQLLSQQLGEAQDPQHPTCVALIDIDNFKYVNDTFTHAGGDDVLRAVAEAMRACVRESDTAARLAGDEFVVLFPRTTQEDALQVCERISEAVAGMSFDGLSSELRVSVSVGMAQAHAEDTPASLLHRSDVAMFRNKERGSQHGVTVF